MTDTKSRQLRGSSNWTRIPAKYSGTCPACQCRIAPGQPVVKVPAIPGWLHDGDCVDAAEALIRARAWRRCGGATKSGHPCRNWVITADATRCSYHLHDPG